MDELVVLVDDQDNPIGTLPKTDVHHSKTPLHRAFSVFIFNQNNELLVQQRAKSKKTWGGVWSNSCCGHPLPGESREDGLARRVLYELGITLSQIEKVADYRYRFERDGVVENEICPIYYAETDDVVKPNPDEVEGYSWMAWKDFKRALRTEGNKWSEWSREEAELVEKFGKPH